MCATSNRRSATRSLGCICTIRSRLCISSPTDIAGNHNTRHASRGTLVAFTHDGHCNDTQSRTMPPAARWRRSSGRRILRTRHGVVGTFLLRSRNDAHVRIIRPIQFWNRAKPLPAPVRDIARSALPGKQDVVGPSGEFVPALQEKTVLCQQCLR